MRALQARAMSIVLMQTRSSLIEIRRDIEESTRTMAYHRSSAGECCTTRISKQCIGAELVNRLASRGS